MLWMGLTALAMRYPLSVPLGLQFVVGIGFAVACASGCIIVVAACLRFDTRRSRVLDSFAHNAFSIYVIHYIFVVWLQYAMLGAALFAIAKASIVFSGTLLLAWATATLLRFVPFATSLFGVVRGARVRASSVPDDFATRTPI
jgi:surface polysaccharide O-acyltransferase-like enzyme